MSSETSNIPPNRPSTSLQGGGRQPQQPVQKTVPIWLSALGILVGLLFVGIYFFGPGLFMNELFQGSNESRLALSIGFGLILTGFGTQAAGTWKSWSVAGSGAIAIALYLLLSDTPEKTSQTVLPDPVIDLRIEGGFHPETKIVVVEGKDNERLYTKWVKVPYQLKVRIEKRHLQAACITFSVFRPTKDKDDEDDTPTYVPAGFFEQWMNKAPPAGARKDPALRYENESNTLFTDQENKIPISFDSCPVGLAEKESKTESTDPSLLQRFVNLLLPGVLAAEAKPSINDLIKDLSSRNALVRREARQLLVAKNIEAVAPLMDALRKAPRSYQLRYGAVRTLSEMMAGHADTAQFRKRLSEADLRVLATFVAHDKKEMRYSATAVMVRLADPRAVDMFLNTLKAHPNPNGRYNAAKILAETFETLDPNKKRYVAAKLKDIAADQGEKTRELINPILAWTGEPSGASKAGWVYVGINYGKRWAKKNFTWDDETRQPRKGDVLTATDFVNLRADHNRFDMNKGWVNARKLGVIRRNDKVRVIGTKTVAVGFHWVKVERVR